MVNEGIADLFKDTFANDENEVKLDSSIPPRFRRPAYQKRQRNSDRKTAKATGWARLNDLLEAVMTLEEGTDLWNAAYKWIMQTGFAMKRGLRMNFQRSFPLAQTLIHVPTELGYMVTINIQLPLTVSIRGDIKGEITGLIKANLKPM